MANQEQAAIKRATLAAQQQVVELDAASLDALQQLYRQAAKDIAKRIASYAGPDGNIQLYQLQDLLAQVNMRLQALSAARDALLNQSLDTSANLGTEPVTGNGGLSELEAQQVVNRALTFVRTFVAEDGLQLSDRLWRLDRHARDILVNRIEQSIIQGHGAFQAARELLMRGQTVSRDISDKANSANAGEMGASVDGLLTGEGSPLDNAMRLMRTEINRAHGEAYIMGALTHPNAIGVRYKLSPAHPRPDICDLLSTQNLYGLGPGVYPDRESCPWPAHPNILSFLEIVFKDEITEDDAAGEETPMEALARLTPDQRKGVLGASKADVYDQGKLTQGMIRAPWSAVQKRISRA